MKVIATFIITIAVTLSLLVLGAFLDGYVEIQQTKEQQQ